MIDADASLENEPGFLFDGLVLPDGDEAVAALAQDGHTAEFIKDQFRHCKPILVLGASRMLLSQAGLPLSLDKSLAQGGTGLIVAEDGSRQGGGRSLHEGPGHAPPLRPPDGPAAGLAPVQFIQGPPPCPPLSNTTPANCSMRTTSRSSTCSWNTRGWRSPAPAPDGEQRQGHGARTADARAALARKICNELTVHAQIEEEIFYPALREVIDTPELLDEAQAEHQQAKELIARIESLKQDGSAMDELVSQLARVVEQHVKEERDHLFPKARAADALDLDELGAKLKERQQQLEAQLASGRGGREP